MITEHYPEKPLGDGGAWTNFADPALFRLVLDQRHCTAVEGSRSRLAENRRKDVVMRIGESTNGYHGVGPICARI